MQDGTMAGTAVAKGKASPHLRSDPRLAVSPKRHGMPTSVCRGNTRLSARTSRFGSQRKRRTRRILGSLLTCVGPNPATFGPMSANSGRCWPTLGEFGPSWDPILAPIRRKLCQHRPPLGEVDPVRADSGLTWPKSTDVGSNSTKVGQSCTEFVQIWWVSKNRGS